MRMENVIEYNAVPGKVRFNGFSMQYNEYLWVHGGYPAYSAKVVGLITGGDNLYSNSFVRDPNKKLPMATLVKHLICLYLGVALY